MPARGATRAIRPARAAALALAAATALVAAPGCAGRAVRAHHEAAAAEFAAIQAQQEAELRADQDTVEGATEGARAEAEQQAARQEALQARIDAERAKLEATEEKHEQLTRQVERAAELAERRAALAAAGADRREEAHKTMGQPLQPVSTADPEDVATIESTIHALYDVISGEAGEERDWKRFDSLFFPGVARLAATLVNAEGEVALSWFDPAGYRERAGPMFAQQPFYEREAARRVDRFGHIVQVFSTYESATTADGEAFQRGINSIQLYHDGARWWIVTVLWDAERPEQPIPREYLGG